MKDNKTKKSNKKKSANKKNTVTKATKVENNKVNKKEQPKEVVKVEKVKVEERKETELVPITSNEMAKLAKITLIVTAVFLIFYGITILVTDNKKEETELGEATIQYDEILLGNIFDQPANDYYVLVTKEDDDYAAAYSTYVSMYSAKTNAIRVYTSNLDNGFNNSFEAEESKTNTNNIEELKLKGSTLLKISNKKVVAAYEGSLSIIEHLKSISK